LKQLRVLGAIPGAHTENKNQGDKAQYDAEGCFCSSPEKASLKKKSRAKLHTVKPNPATSPLEEVVGNSQPKPRKSQSVFRLFLAPISALALAKPVGQT